MTKERPIIFSGPMVRAVLEGRKTQSRRIMTPQPRNGGVLDPDNYYFYPYFPGGVELDMNSPILPPYGLPGDRLWVRETFWSPASPDTAVYYDADSLGRLSAVCAKYKKSPAIHMPRWASRITLAITGVRVERLQSITEDDAKAEGVNISDPCSGVVTCAVGCWRCPVDPVEAFSVLWNSIYGARPGASWAENPYIWVINFVRSE